MSDTRGPRLGLTLKIFGASALVIAVVLGGTIAVVSARATRAADEALHSRLDNTVAVAGSVIEADNGKLASGASVAAQITPFIAAVTSGDRSSLIDNATTVITSVVKAKPTVAKGKYVKGCYLSSSMGPGISIDTSAVEAAAKV